MANLGGMFGDGSMGRQLLVWGVLNQLLSTAMQPVMQQLLDEEFPKLPSTPLSAADAAELVLKGWMHHEEGATEASATGVNSERFAQLVNNAGEPIAMDQALQALRREIIPDDAGAGGGVSFMQAVRESRLRTEWGPVLRELQWLPLPAADAVDAVVENQISYAEGEAQAKINGIKPEIFRILVHTRGNPPGVSELLEMHRRGIIPMNGTGPDATTVEQGVYEGATKDKWFKPLSGLLAYVPPPRTVTALEREGAITAAEAMKLYQESGLTPELAAVYAKAASGQKLAKHKDLAESLVLEMYEAHILSAAQTTEALEALNYNAQEAQWLMSLRDMRRSLTAVNSAVTRIGSLYVARKITNTDAINALNALGIPDAQRNQLMTTWKLEQAATVKTLTEAQVTAAVYYKVITAEQGQQYLEQLGYSPYDAWVLISARMHGATGPAPAEGANVAGRAQ